MNANLAYDRREERMATYLIHRKDANHDEIKAALEAVGATVSFCNADLLVGFRGVNYMLEVKTRTGRQNNKQRKFQAEWKGHYAVTRTAEAALKEIGATR